jgi:serine protease Do
MRVWVAVMVLYFLAASAARGSVDSLSATRRQTFTVQSRVGNHGRIGSGVVVASDGGVLTIATAAHLIAPNGILRILDVTRRAYYRVLDVRVLPDYDLAFIRVEAQPQFPVTPVAFAPAVAGERVWLWGNPKAGFWTLATGAVKQTHAELPGVFGSPRVTIACPACAPGDSGAGVFDARGRLLGILTHAWRNADGGPVLFIEIEPAALVSQEATVKTEVAASAKTARLP